MKNACKLSECIGLLFFYPFLVNLKGFDSPMFTTSAIFGFLVLLDAHGKHGGKSGWLK
jgi:hypothetical protein